ncbi:MAG TPA: hypothetical protein VG034_11850 [Acidimicrobiia bacterium]|nr:hypothetical protein [Acidimicrobiia bacterium]
MSSPNVTFLGNVPTATAMMAISFASDAPIAYVSTFNGLQVYDISNPALPLLLSAVVLNGVFNESFELGERPNGEKFVLFAVNFFAADATGYVNPHQRVVTVLEVTDPRNPRIVGHVETPTRTHTATCLDPPACTFAYTDGRTADEQAGFKPGGSVIDLRDFRNPKVAGVFPSVVPRAHDHALDDTGIVWRSGQEGTVALDASDPTAPKQLNSTDEHGIGEGGGDVPNPSGEQNVEEFLEQHHHNAYRPHAGNFASTLDDQGQPTSGAPDIFKGNVLLVTQEVIFHDSAHCSGGKEGQLQTWYVPFLNADRYAQVNPEGKPGRGTIRPLAKWNTELFDTGLTIRRPGLCSAHYFEARDDGFLASAWFEQGLRVLDVRDPLNIKQVGYFFVADQETVDARWVPAYDTRGHQTGEPSDVVYTADNWRGIDILRVDLSEAKRPGANVNLTAPILKQWLEAPRTPASTPSPEWGYACRVPVGTRRLPAP